MKLFLENEFTWDGLYGMLDETGNSHYVIDAHIETSGRVIDICEAADDENKLGQVRQKRVAKRPEYDFEIRGHKVGSIERRGADYDISFADWFVSGDLLQWRFRIVDKHGDIATSCVVDDSLGLDVIDDKNALGASVLLMGIAGLVGDLVAEFNNEGSDRSDVHDVIDSVQNFAGKTAKFGKKTFEAIEKIYGLYEEPSNEPVEGEDLIRKSDMHDFADGVENVVDKIGEAGHKTLHFIEKIYGLDDEEQK